MLTLVHLKKYYATQKAVDDISLKIEKGKIFGLLGPNGAGKSSLLRMVTGITLPDSGKILYDGQEYNQDIHNQWIGYMPEERGLYKKMKIGEQAMYLARLKGLNKIEAMQKINYWFKRLDMESWWNKKVEDLSKGMSQKLQFVTTVLHNPKVLILDEPFSGLDPVNSEIIKQEIFELSKQGVSIIFSTHRMEQVEEICEEIALINQGKIVLEGNVLEIKNRFKKNLYRLAIQEELQGFESNIVQKNMDEYILQFANDQEPNSLLQHCINQHYHIKTFEEILPSLNEIFIQQVENTQASRQFLN
ncbi:MAG TPA: ATP-binding cassette domain-containing protein [Chitinophagaceae bacterium]|nr:MAG: Fe(3+)-transporting ATPase [Bacteroidetes bacterium OLB11]HMN33508.1 ATP-binding cassette domain-containing protein [Chitinophagaceae bacterium]